MKIWVMPVVLIIALAAFTCGVIFMPAAELMPAQVQSGSWMPGLSPLRNYHAMQTFKSVGDQLTQWISGQNIQEVMKQPLKDGIPGEVRSYIIYAGCMSLAMIFAAIAFNVIGRFESEEKTVIPVKK